MEKKLYDPNVISNDTISYKPKFSRFANGGVQYLYVFENGYGASVVCHDFSYGGSEGLYELAVINNIEGDAEYFDICYDTHITDDVLGHLTPQDVQKILDQIKEL